MTTTAIDAPTTSVSTATPARSVLAQALLLGILADSTLAGGLWGLGWSAFVAGVTLTVLLLTLKLGVPMRRETAAWLVVAAACGIFAAWRDAEMLRLANFGASLVALGIAALTLAGNPNTLWGSRIRDVLESWRRSTGGAIAGAGPLVGSEVRFGEVIESRRAAALPALRAGLLTIPLLVVFGGLFASADPVFASLFDFGLGIPDLAAHGFRILIAAWITAGWLRAVFVAPPKPRGETFGLRLGAVEVGASLGALNVLFAIFVGLQARWLFGGAAVIEATTGLSVAEYARRGFFELVFVAALLLPVILITRAAATDDATLARHRLLSSSLLVLLGAIMVSAMLRMQLYVGYYGLSEDRLYASVAMAWLAIVFVAMALTVLRGWTKPFAAVTAISAFATLLVLNVANPDMIIARTNLARTAGARSVDYEYLARLSGDARRMVARAIATAPATQESCDAARLTLRRADESERDKQWNWGATSGRAATYATLGPAVLRRLCGSSANGQ